MTVAGSSDIGETTRQRQKSAKAFAWYVAPYVVLAAASIGFERVLLCKRRQTCKRHPFTCQTTVGLTSAAYLPLLVEHSDRKKINAKDILRLQSPSVDF